MTQKLTVTLDRKHVETYLAGRHEARRGMVAACAHVDRALEVALAAAGRDSEGRISDPERLRLVAEIVAWLRSNKTINSGEYHALSVARRFGGQ